jgi:hypothetical protein
MNEQRPLAYKTHPAEWFLSLTRKERAEQIRFLPVNKRNGRALYRFVRRKDAN